MSIVSAPAVAKFALFVATASMWAAIYGFWFGRWAVNIWVGYAPHLVVAPASVAISAIAIIIVCRNFKINGLSFLTIMLIIALLILISPTIIKNDWHFHLVTNYYIYAIFSLIVAIFLSKFYAINNNHDVGAKWVRWWHVFSCIVLAILFRGLRGDFGVTAPVAGFVGSSELMVLFLFTGPLTLVLLALATPRQAREGM